MNRYPHKIIIQKVVTESSPYADAEYETVYEGRCRCFMDGRSSIDTQGDSESDYQVVIPSPKMVDVGENYKVGVKFQHTSNGKEWDVIGYVVDFARYDRVCNLYFSLEKDQQIEEDTEM